MRSDRWIAPVLNQGRLVPRHRLSTFAPPLYPGRHFGPSRLRRPRVTLRRMAAMALWRMMGAPLGLTLVCRRAKARAWGAA